MLPLVNYSVLKLNTQFSLYANIKLKENFEIINTNVCSCRIGTKILVVFFFVKALRQLFRNVFYLVYFLLKIFIRNRHSNSCKYLATRL